MGLGDRFRALLGDGSHEVYECRACGTTLAPGEECCPYCGPTDVVRFDLAP